MNPHQPDLIPNSKITHTLFCTRNTLDSVLNLIPLFSARILSIGYPRLISHPATIDITLTIDPESLNPLLSLLPFDPSLPLNLQPPHKSPRKHENVPF